MDTYQHRNQTSTDYSPTALSGFGFCAIALLLVLFWIVWTYW